jgi:hypothetical protein
VAGSWVSGCDLASSVVALGSEEVWMTWDVAVHAAPGARFVDADEYRKHKQKYVGRTMVDQVLTDALASAADDEGVIANFWLPDFYAKTLREEMRDEYDEDDYQLTYDRFTAMALTEHLTSLVMAGLLGHRGKGGSYDYRLALPE